MMPSFQSGPPSMPGRSLTNPIQPHYVTVNHNNELIAENRRKCESSAPAVPDAATSPHDGAAPAQRTSAAHDLCHQPHLPATAHGNGK